MSLTTFSFQENAVDKAIKRDGLLFIHPTGSGKTVTVLALVSRLVNLNKRGILIVAPANTLSHYLSVRNKYFRQLDIIIQKGPFVLGHDVSLISYDMLKRHKSSLPHAFELIVLDEVHHCKNSETQNSAIAWEFRGRTRRFIGMTGTPYQNSFMEFSEVINLTANSRNYIFPDDFLERKWDYKKVGFLQRWWHVYIKRRPLHGPVIGFKNKDVLRRKLCAVADVVPEDKVIQETGRPIATTQIEHVQLEANEWKIYKKVTRGNRGKELHRLDLDLYNDEEIRRSFNGLSRARQALLIPNYCIANSKKIVSSKIQKITDAIYLSKRKSLVFCNFIANGTDYIARELENNGIRAKSYTGKLTKRSRIEVLQEYRAGATDVLCMSPVRGEGLDIPEAEEIYIADLHFNPEVVRQMIGRALRAGSRLKEVDVKIFLAHGPNGERTVDDRIFDIFQRKERLISELRTLIEN
jgi:superfamily II DNA or RNA helicase